MDPIRRGDHGPVVTEIRVILARLGLLNVQGGVLGALFDDTFDDAVDAAVRQFQQRRGLRVDGVVGDQSYRALQESRWRLGDRVLFYSPAHLFRGDDVSTLQQRLHQLGFDSGRVDGIFGRLTEKALRDFQRNTGLKTDGTAGPETFAALSRLARTVVGGRPNWMRERERLHRSGPGLAGKVVIVDPVGGGEDRGPCVGALCAGEVVEDLAARIEGRLTAMGVLAYLTRSRTRNPTPSERAQFANDLGADLLISLEVDLDDNPKAEGSASYYFGSSVTDVDSSAGERFATLVQSELTARTDLLDGRTHRKTWVILRESQMPAVQVDVGYLSNEHDRRRLAQPDFRDAVAEAIVVAVQRLYLPEEAGPPTGALRLPAFTS